MKEYKIKITGEYDVIVLSPDMIARLVDAVRSSDTKELVIPAEEILPQGYAGYLNRVLDANPELAGTLPDRNAYTLIAEQIKKMQFDEKDCFDSVNVTHPEEVPLLDVEASEDFYIVTKQDNNRFRYVFQNENGEEVSIVLEYL
jgi:hypothetical protein